MRVRDVEVRGANSENPNPCLVIMPGASCSLRTMLPYAQKVTQVLAFRNTHMDEPYFCPLLLQALNQETESELIMPPETDSTPPMQISQGSAAATFKTTYPIPV
eukprot:7647940-Pyramimonas_sp.AAC.1